MVSRLVGDALLRTEHDDLWTVTCAEYPHGLVRLERRARLTQVVVADRADAATPEVHSYGAAACTVDGELLVALRSAPPAIVVGASCRRTRPPGGTGHDSEFPDPGQRLILLSCAAFEAVPPLLVDGDEAAAGRLATQDPESLLLALLGQGARGAGAVIDRHPDAGGATS